MLRAQPAGGEAPPRAVYLGLGQASVFTLLHVPPSPSTDAAAVLLCPPFGWDDVCSYRSRRAWAEALAAAGHPVARIDLPGSGDSGGSPRDPERLEAWTSAVSDAARWLRAETGCMRVAAVGIGLGGLVACRAVALGSPIEDLVLWAVPARGRTLIRELRAFARLKAEPSHEHAATLSSPAPGDELEVAGFIITPETIASLEALDLTVLPVPEANRRRVLLLERDGLAPDRRLREHFESAGMTVTVTDGKGYGPMMDDPRLARAPREAFERTITWLAQAPRSGIETPTGGVARAPTVIARNTIEFSTAGAGAGEAGVVRETPLSFETEAGRLFGVLAEPVDVRMAGVCAVLLNAGAIRRIGPNRMWVEIARRWAAQGVPSLRIDLRALGDSDGDERRYASNDEYYLPELTELALAALDELEARNLPSCFVLVGLCSGAYWSFRGALTDERVVGAFLINLWSFFWSESLLSDRALRGVRTLLRGRENSEWSAQTILQAALNRRAWRAARQALSGPARRTARRTGEQEIDAALDRLRDRRTEILLQLSDGEPLFDDFVRARRIEDLNRWPNLVLDRIPTSDHTFRALGLQHHVHTSLDQALGRVLAGDGELREGVPRATLRTRLGKG